MPAIVGADGVEKLVPISLSGEEQENLRKSADTLRGVITDVFGKQ